MKLTLQYPRSDEQQISQFLGGNVGDDSIIELMFESKDADFGGLKEQIVEMPAEKQSRTRIDDLARRISRKIKDEYASPRLSSYTAAVIVVA
jgi:hypothetical protein